MGNIIKRTTQKLKGKTIKTRRPCRNILSSSDRSSSGAAAAAVADSFFVCAPPAAAAAAKVKATDNLGSVYFYWQAILAIKRSNILLHEHPEHRINRAADGWMDGWTDRQTDVF